MRAHTVTSWFCLCLCVLGVCVFVCVRVRVPARQNMAQDFLAHFLPSA